MEEKVGIIRPSVSVVIPCYRQAHFLGDAIESVLAQTRPASELVVVDDGSPDDTSGVVSRYPEVRLIRQANKGLAEARNRGFRESNGEHVVFLDADDRLLPGALEVGSQAMERAPESVFVWGFNRPIDSQGKVAGPVSNPYQGPADYLHLLERNIVGPPVGVMFRRGPLEEAGGFSPAPEAVEDYELYLRLARTGAFSCHGEVVGEYRHHGAKMSSDQEMMLRSTLWILAQEEERAGGDRRLVRAVKRGRRNARLVYEVEPTVEDLSDELRDRRWARAVMTAARGITRDPVLFPAVLTRRLLKRLGRPPSAAQ